MNKKKFAKFIIVTQLITVLWLLLCPKYANTGEFKTKKAKFERVASGRSKSGDGPWRTNYRWTVTVADYFRHPDPVYFSAGILIIYMLMASAYLWTDEKQ